MQTIIKFRCHHCYSGSEQDAAVIWDRHSKCVISKLPHHLQDPATQNGVSAVAFHPRDQEILVSVADDCKLRIWMSANRTRHLWSDRWLEIDTCILNLSVYLYMHMLLIQLNIFFLVSSDIKGKCCLISKPGDKFMLTLNLDKSTRSEDIAIWSAHIQSPGRINWSNYYYLYKHITIHHPWQYSLSLFLFFNITKI